MANYSNNSGGSVAVPVSVANGGTGQTAASTGFAALAATSSGQTSTFALSDGATTTAPVSRVLSHTTSGTAAAGFGGGDAIDLQSAAGNLRRVLTDLEALVIATDGAEEVWKNIQIMVAGALQKWGSMGWLINGNNPMLYLGDTAGVIGICRVPTNSVMQAVYATAQMQWSGAGTTSLTRHIFSGRMQQGQGASVSSATTVTLGADGNVFPISGTTTINGIVTTTWSAGAMIYLKFAGILTVTHNSGAPGASAVAIKTTTGANVTTAANSIMALMFDGTFWVQTDPITPGY